MRMEEDIMPTVTIFTPLLPLKQGTLTTVGEGEYWAPNDEQQCNHQSIACARPLMLAVRQSGFPDLVHSHHLFLLTFNDKLFLAPIQNPKSVLDVGTGTGIWAQ